MQTEREVVITGVGVVSPIGIGRDPFSSALCEGRSGIRRLTLAEGNQLPCPIGGEVVDFKAGQYVRPRKALKVMSRDIQMGFAASELALSDAGLEQGGVDPDRLGVAFGADMMPCELDEVVPAYQSCIVEGRFQFDRWGDRALAELYPLWMLKYLPNMPACHIAIGRDARGPNNSLCLGEVSSLAAIVEAMRVVSRGQADVMIAGGASSRLHPTVLARHHCYPLSRRTDDPASAMRPFDAGRDGSVHGEGAAAFTLESRNHAEARKARTLARILGSANAFEPHRKGESLRGDAVRRSIRGALEDARLPSGRIGHVNANGMSTRDDDPVEAQAIREELGAVPVTAPKSYFGNLGAATGAMETAVSVIALQGGLVPPSLNYEQPDPDCPVDVVSGQPMRVDRPTALLLNQARTGQSIALVIAADR